MRHHPSIAEATRIADGLRKYLADLKEQIDAYGDLSTSLALNDLQPAGKRR